MHFDTKSYLKSTPNHTAKQALSVLLIIKVEGWNKKKLQRSISNKYNVKGWTREK